MKDRSEVAAEVLVDGKRLGFCVLRIKPPKPLKAISLSKAPAKTGDKVFAFSSTSTTPDISGVWEYETPDLPLFVDDGNDKKKHAIGGIAIRQKYLIQRATDPKADFTMRDITILSLPGAEPQPLADSMDKPSRLKWSAPTKKFDFLRDDTNATSGATLEPLDRDRLRLTSHVDTAERKRLAKEGRVSEATMSQLLNQVWVRVPTKQLDDATRSLVGSPRLSDAVSAARSPEMRRLLDQLQTHESAAAKEAESIRQLQSEGASKSNTAAIAEHQRKLKSQLSTAFDLKLQLEELQVKELQSRLSRLERQIGQRKELREKIINRRVGELIEGDALKWDSTAPASTKLPGSAVGNTKKTATPEVVAILRERFGLLWDDLRSGKAKPDAVLRALNELALAQPPEAHAQHVERLQALLELVRRLQSADSVSKAELLEIEAAYEKAKSLSDGSSSKTSPTKPPAYVESKP